MMYLIGNKEQREAFEAEHQIPYFRFQEMTDEETCMMHNEDDDAKGGATLTANLRGSRPSFTVLLHGEDGLDAEATFDDYDTALEVYNGEQAPSYFVAMSLEFNRPPSHKSIYAEDFDDLGEALEAYNALDLQAEAGPYWLACKELTMWLADVEVRTIREETIAPDRNRAE